MSILPTTRLYMKMNGQVPCSGRSLSPSRRMVRDPIAEMKNEMVWQCAKSLFDHGLTLHQSCCARRITAKWYVAKRERLKRQGFGRVKRNDEMRVIFVIFSLGQVQFDSSSQHS